MNKKTMALRLALDDDMTIEKIAREINATEKDVIRWLGGEESVTKETNNKNINVNAKIDIKITKE